MNLIIDQKSDFRHLGGNAVGLDHKQMTKHIRGRLSANGIKARCRLYTACGVRYIQVFPPTADALFTDEESTLIKRIAKCNKLTGARGMDIDENIINVHGGDFEFHG